MGITDDEIRVAMIADVENAVVPGLFQPSVDVVRAWAKNLNKKGGIAGRKVVVDFIDSKLSANEARNAAIQACADDFAMVGGEALFLNNVDDMVACPTPRETPPAFPTSRAWRWRSRTAARPSPSSSAATPSSARPRTSTRRPITPRPAMPATT